jgi:integrase
LRIEEGAARGSISIELTQLRRSYNLALQAERITKKPHFPTIKLNNARQGFFEKADLERVLAKLPEHARGSISFAYVTGWRLRSEILPLTWTQVDFDGGRVRLEPGTTKNREGRWFPMTTELRAILSEAWQDHMKNHPGCPYVFHFQGERIRRIDRAWKTASKEAGLSGKLMHDFRRTAVRNLVRAGISERVAMMLTGHKTRVVFDRYNIVSETDLTEVGKRLDEAFSPRTTTVSTTITPQTTENVEIIQ